MHELDFRPNRAARSLSTRRSRTIGILAASGSSLFGPASSVDAIEAAARESGYAVTIAHAVQPSTAGIADAAGQLAAQSVDGIVVLAPWRHAERALADLRFAVPTVALYGAPPAGGHGRLAADQDAGARAAAKHLADLGHRRVAHIAGPADWTEAVARRDAFVDELERVGVDVLVTGPGDWSAQAGYLAASDLLADASITAVFAANDQQAIGVLRAAAERGREVPGDSDRPGGLSVVGFDDIPEAAYLTPPLTTVRQDFTGLGRAAVRRLLERVEGIEPVAVPVVTTRLVVRRSTGRPFA